MFQNALIRFRRPLVLLVHAGLGALSWTLAFVIRFDGWPDADFHRLWLFALPIAVLVKSVAVSHFRLTSGLWRYVSINDLVRLLQAVTMSSLVITALVIFVHGQPYSRGVLAVDYILTMALFGGVRFAGRLYREMVRPSLRPEAGRRTLIIGAGDTGDMALRSLTHNFAGVYNPVAFLDDDPMKLRTRIHDVPIVGAVNEAPDWVGKLEINDVVIAIPNVGKGFIRSVVEGCAAHNVNFHIMPTFREFDTGEVVVDELREVRVEDLLGREPVDLDRGIVEEELRGRCVMVTGAGGSIGSELVRQIAQFEPGHLVLVDVAESALFDIAQETRWSREALPLSSAVADIRDPRAVETVFERFRPQRVYHAAAYKHVPLMEEHPDEAVLNNIAGTMNLVRAAQKHEVERFVMISTDKAVRPTSVMGATKRCAEILVAAQSGQPTKFTTVRFGNVLGSNGSVVPTFRRQIQAGGPVTVTHPEITRYFMTIPEAVELVLQAGTLGTGGEVFVLEMGEPIKIVDLARNMIELSGLEVDKDIEIEFTGLRPGEKLYEELVAHGEDVSPTSIPSVMVHNGGKADLNRDDYVATLESLCAAAAERDRETTKRLLWELVRRNDPDIEVKEQG